MIDRSHRRSTLRLVVAAACVVVTATAWATPAHPAEAIESILARPVSPGALALLIEYSTDPRAWTRWIEALQHSDPHVRATAGRLLYVSSVTTALPQLRQALSVESDASAAIEIARPIVSMGEPSDGSALLDAAARIPAPGLALSLARKRKGDAISELAAFMRLKLSKPTAGGIAAALVANNATALDRVARAALEASAVPWWEAALSISLELSLPIPDDQLRSALQSPVAEMRDATWWYGAILAGRTRQVLSVFPSDPRHSIPDQSSASMEGTFARELVARALNSSPVEQSAFERALPSGVLNVPSFVPYALTVDLVRLLTKSERDALGIGPVEPHSLASRPSLPPTPVGTYAAIRTIDDLPDGFVADVLRSTGCSNRNSEEIAGAAVRFEGGRLRQLQWIGTNLSPACGMAAHYITAASLLPELAVTPGKQELVTLPMHATFVECLSRVDPPAEEPTGYRIGLGRGITPPRKIRNVGPVYPPNAFKERREGIVVLETTIAPSGCIRQAKVVRDAGFDLDIAALRAVTDWAFTPTLLDGKPVPVIMTVTVQFKLQ